MDTSELVEIGDIGDLMPLDDFKDACESGMFIDYDGFGELATEDKTSKIYITPSMLRTGFKIPGWCTHVLWFNR